MPDLTWQVIKSRSDRCLEHSKKKVVGEPDEGKPHVRFEVAGNGNQAHDAQAPFPDPTTRAAGFSPPKWHFSWL